MDPVVKAIGELEEEHKPLPSPLRLRPPFLFYIIRKEL